MTQDQTAVLEVVEQMTAAFMGKDIVRVMQSYEAQAAVMFEPGMPTRDPERLAEMFTAMSAVNPQFTYAGHEVVVSGDTALHIAPWSMRGTAQDGTEIVQSGLSVAVLRRQVDGSWRMVIDNPHGGHLINAN